MSFEGILGRRRSEERPVEQPVSTTRQVLGATVAETLETNPTAAMYRERELQLAREIGRPMAAEAARARLKDAGLDAHLTVPDQGITEEALDILMERKRVELKRAEIEANSRGGAALLAGRLGVGFAASLADPLNVATAFVPVVSPARYARWLAAARGLPGRAAVRAGVGAVEGVVGAALVEPLIIRSKAEEQADYSGADSLANIAFGGVFGGGLHVAGGGASDLLRLARGQPLVAPDGTPTLPPVPEPEVPRGTLLGGETAVRVGDAYVPARWAIVEADEVAATMSKAENQFRDRTRAASEAQIRDMAAKLDFNLLGDNGPLMDVGAPTLTREGVVLGGNGRMAAIRAVYEGGTGYRYQEPLREALARFGVDVEELGKFRRPVLVRVLAEDVDVRRTAIASNEGGALRMSALEQATVDAERLGSLDGLDVGEAGELNRPANLQLIRRWVGEQPVNQRAALQDADGFLSVEGLQRLRNAVLYRAFGDSPTLARLIEATDPGLRNVAAALTRAAGRVAEVRGGIKAGDLYDLDISPDVQAAVEKLVRLRDEGMTVDAYLAQGKMFGDELSAEAVEVLRFLDANVRSPAGMADFLTRYYEGVIAAGSPKQADIFGEGPPSRAALLERAAGRVTPAAEVVAGLRPETREAALRTAVAQAVTGREIDVEAVVDLDPSRQTGADPVAAAVAAAERNASPEQASLVDFDAAAAVPEPGPRAPVLDEADAALDEAMTLAEDTAKAGEEAYKFSRAPVFQSQALRAVEALPPTTATAAQWIGRLYQPERTEKKAIRDPVTNKPTGEVKEYRVEASSPLPGVKVEELEWLGVLDWLRSQGSRRVTTAELADYIRANEIRVEEVLRESEAGMEVGERLTGRSVKTKFDQYQLPGGGPYGELLLTLPPRRAAPVEPVDTSGWTVEPRAGGGALLEAAVRQSFGDATDALVEAGRIRIVNKATDIPGGRDVPPDVRAAYAPDGTTYIVAANTPPELVRGLVLHEVGVHAGMQEMLGPELFARTLDEVDRLAVDGDAAVLRARSMVPVDTPAAHVREETLAYLVQQSPELPLVRRVLAAIKAWLFRVTRGTLGTLSPDELVSLAQSALRRQARTLAQPEAGAFAYSRGANRADDPKAELQPFDDAIKRADLYGRAVRAAAERLGSDDAARAAMRAATADKLAAEEIDALLTQLKAENRRVRGQLRKAREQFTSEDAADALQADAMQAADTLANNIALDAKIAKRNAALALTARTRGAGRILNEFAANPREGLMALLGGSQFARQGSKDSVFHWQRQYFVGWAKGLMADLEQAGLAEAFVRNAYDRSVARALYQLGREKPRLDGIEPEAVKIAQLVHKYFEDARTTRNRFGAWIGRLDDYIGSQTHDFVKISKAGRDAWKDFVRSRLDVERTMGERAERLEDMLDGLYNDFAAGRHMASGPADKPALGVAGSLARRVSQSRVLHFKDADAQFEYLQRFGVGRLHEAVLADLTSASREAGLLRVLGPNPTDTLTRIMDEVEESLVADPVKRRAFYEGRGQAEALLAMLDGRANIPGSHLAARVSAGVRAWQSMSKLGGAVVSAVTDLPVYASQVRYQGRGGLLSGVGEGLGRLLQGRPKGAQREVLRMIGTVADGMIGGIAARFDADELLSGNTAELMRIYFRFNGLQWWTDTLREGMELGTSNWLAGLRGQSWERIGADAQRLFTQYGIDGAKWDVIRQAALAAADGRQYLTPEGMSAVPESVLRAYIERAGRTVTEAGIANARRDLADTLRAFIVDQAMTAVIEPDVRSRYFLTRGTRPGTAAGEALRFVGQFKGFPTALTRQVFGREIYGRGYDSLGDYLRRGKGDMLGLAQMILAMTVFGYAAMSAKDLLKGKRPRDPQSPQTWLAAMLQGGALGIYGDFLLGQSNRFGRNVVDTLAGPTLGLVGDLDDLRQRAMRGDDTAAAAVRVVTSNTPFLNLFYTRTALDYLILYRVQEALNPGSLRRMERRMEREQGQTYLMPPSEAVN